MSFTDEMNFDKSAETRLAILLQGLGAPVSCARRGSWGQFAVVAMADCLAVSLVVTGQFLPGFVASMLARVAIIATRLVGSDRASGHTGRQWMLAVLVWVVALAAILLSRSPGAPVDWLRAFPSSSALFQTTSGAIDQSIRFLTQSMGPFFDQIRNGLNALITAVEVILGLLPWPVYFLFFGLIAWWRGGIVVLAVVWLCLGYLGLFGYWEKAIITSALVLASLCICMVIGIPLGILMAKNRMLRTVMEPVLDFMQTLPSFVYLMPAVAFFSIGKPPALVATVIFAMPPLIRLTSLGIGQVPTYVREALFAHGATPLQCLIKAELPLALPSIRAGVNQCIMMSLAMVVIAALIGGGGLGYDVLFALQNVQYGQGLLAGISIVACAMLFDRLLGGSGGPKEN